ncbi:MAG: Tritrans,polycis-undecaprenyl-diphosphate synthase (GGDP specific) [Methanosaeta sp. PtaU1.Bin112]|nr:MAG: Tritrans,polycis-undecaprenyl-diphosphate synthase (GGDP specific) [Methanosaeta sp. PtaU1.Bin112]
MSFSLRNPAYIFYERLLKSRILAGVPVEHVAIIQDGNRRYAMEKGISRFMGHSLGADTSENVSDWCLELGVKHLTLYTFSTENFNRDEIEKRHLFDLIKNKFMELGQSKKVHANGVRVRAIGRVEMLPRDLQEQINRTEQATREYKTMYLNVALAYGGQRELVDAARSLARQVSRGMIEAADVDEDLIASHLYPQDGVSVPKVDLIIRTGGDCRTSNFLPWQANGNECAAYFCAPYWPEFRKIDFLRAIRTAQTRGSGQQA